MTSVSLTKGAAETVERDARGRIRLTSAGNRNMSVQLTLLVLAVLTVVTFVRMDFGSTDLAAITAICTVISAIVSFFLALAASENLSNPAVSNVVKGFVAVIRSIPTILWVLVFTVAIGLGAEAAVLGISFHSIAYLVKSYSESFEEIDAGVIEALRASGASFWQVVFQAITPATITKLLSWTFIRLEINFTNAVAVGAFAGAGGIGFQLFQAGSRYYNLHEVGVIVYVCLIAAFVLEYISVRLRRRYILNS